MDLGFEGVLVLGVGLTASDADILHGLEEGGGSRDTGELGAETIDDLGRAGVALVQGLEGDEGEAAVGGALAAGEAHDVLHGGVLLDDGDRALDGVAHAVEGGVLRALHAALDGSGVLLGEEAFGDLGDEEDVEAEGAEEDEQDEGGMIEGPAQGAAIEGEDAVEAALAPLVDAAVLDLAFWDEDARTHHGGGGEGDDHRDEDGGRKGDGELAEEAADDAAHQQQGDEDGDERDGDGEDGEADLLRSHQRGLDGGVALFEMAGDVLHDDDGVVHDEAAGDGEGHEREVVEREAADVHDGTGADEGDGDGDRGDEGGADVAQEDEDDQDDEDDGDDERQFDVVDGGADGDGAVEDGDQVLAGGDGGLERWQCGLDGVDGGDDVGAGLAEDEHVDGGLAVEEAGLADGLLRVDDVGYILQADGSAVVVADDERLVGGGLGDLVVGQDVGGGVAIGELTLGGVRVLAGDDLLHRGQADAVAGELIGIQLHADGGQ